MADLHLLDNKNYPWGMAYEIIRSACAGRLGYTVTRLLEEPGCVVRLSPREDAGIGIDSDIPEALRFHTPGTAGDYHQWSMFSLRERRPGHHLSDIAVYNMPPEALKTLRGLKRRVNDLRSVGIWFDTVSLAIGSLIYENRKSSVTSEGKIAQITNNPEWRRCARDFSVQLVKEARSDLEKDSGKMLEQLDDINRGKRVVGTAQPVVDAIRSLLDMYAHDLEI